MIPEPSLNPPESGSCERCSLCMQQPAELLELPYGLFCRSCLADRLLHGTTDDAAALLTASIIQLF